MNKIIYLVIFSLCACTTNKQFDIYVNTNHKDMAIHTAIEDFSKHSKLFKQDSVFKVIFHEKVYPKSTVCIYDSLRRRNKYIKINGPLNSNVVSVAIFKSFFRYRQKNIQNLPNQYCIVDGKLFYWDDERSSITKEDIQAMDEYNILLHDSMPQYITLDDGQLFTYYYFCKNDFTQFKKVETSYGIEKIPNICSLKDTSTFIQLMNFPITYILPLYRLTLFKDSTFLAIARKGSIMFNNQDEEFDEPIAHGVYHRIDENIIELVSLKDDKAEELEFTCSKSLNKETDSLYFEVGLSSPLMNRKIKPYRIEFVLNGQTYNVKDRKLVIPKDSISLNTSKIKLEIYIYNQYCHLNTKKYSYIPIEEIDVINANNYIFNFPNFTNAFLHRIYFDHTIIQLN